MDGWMDGWGGSAARVRERNEKGNEGEATTQLALGFIVGVRRVVRRASPSRGWQTTRAKPPKPTRGGGRVSLIKKRKKRLEKLVSWRRALKQKKNKNTHTSASGRGGMFSVSEVRQFSWSRRDVTGAAAWLEPLWQLGLAALDRYSSGAPLSRKNLGRQSQRRAETGWMFHSRHAQPKPQWRSHTGNTGDRWE